ncbi:cupin domain-containing protein [Labrys monachus]|uniref:Mannose-6-phosphate isomerase-like protein (Cupin superfamily) n=1 Tax=Labrys monachus TaxID=217067 RepID=A0ABU0FNP0_9HYPH|nr:cupin domain-containing protein [Labrys monachus]MDQ0396229.1 mannose-6-phosphate isomerase-like protein (cupin superfamily) [Labrys monachus]
MPGNVTSQAVIAGTAQREREGWDDASRGNASWFTLFCADRTPTSAMSAGIMELSPAGGILEPHRHRQAEIYFVAEGTGILTIDGVETRISAGTAAFIPGDAEHSLRNDSAALLRIFYVFPTDRFADVVYRFPGEGD